MYLILSTQTHSLYLQSVLTLCRDVWLAHVSTAAFQLEVMWQKRAHRYVSNSDLRWTTRSFFHEHIKDDASSQRQILYVILHSEAVR